MANENIQLTLSSKADLSGFTAAQKGVKDFGRANKDQLDAAKNMAGQLSAKIGGELGGAFKGVSSTINEMVKGGLWGALGSVATVAVQKIIDKFRETEEAEKAVAEYMAGRLKDSVKAVSDEIDAMSKRLAEANKGVQDTLKNAVAWINQEAGEQIRAIQQNGADRINDRMTEAEKALVKAETDYAASIAKAKQALDIANAEEEAARSAENAARRAAAEARQNYANAQAENNRAVEENVKLYSQHLNLQAAVSAAYERYKNATNDGGKAAKNLAEKQTALAEFEKQHGNILKALEGAEENAAKAKAAIAVADKAYRDAVGAHELVTRRLTQAEQAVERAELERNLAMKAANEALDKETRARAAAKEAEEVNAYLAEREANIVRICTANRVDSAAYIERFNELMDQEVDENEAYVELQKMLNAELKARAEAEKAATVEAEKAADGKTEEKKKPGVAMTVTLDRSAMQGIGEGVEKKQNFRQWMRHLRDEQRKARDEKNNMKIDQPKMVRALKGEMPQAEAKAWMEYAKAKYTPEQMKELGKLAMNSEMLSKSESQKQLKFIEKMATEISLALQVR